jgi:hypothetical protein
MSKNDEAKFGDMIPVKDAAGNNLTIGSLVVWTGCKNSAHIVGRVADYVPGGISLIETGEKQDKKSPARVKVVFEMTILCQPGMTVLGDYFRIINPQAETLIGKILEKSDLTM